MTGATSQHGTRSRYCAGCRCDACRAANTAYYHDKRARDLGNGPTRLCACGCDLPVHALDARRRYIDGHQPRWVGKVAAAPDADVYAEQLLGISEQIIAAVHDEGPEQVLIQLRRVFKLPRPDGVDPLTALVTILAAQVDPDTTGEQRLGWTRRFATPDDSPRRATAPRKESAA